MSDPALRRMVQVEVMKALQIITSGSAGNNTTTTEDINSLFAGMPSIPARPIMHPYGFISRATKGTISVTAQQGNHPGNKMTLGHRDAKAPDVGVGESAVYSDAGYVMKVENGEIKIGKGGDFETVVVGDTLKTLLITIIDAIVAHNHLGNLSAPTGPPINAADFTAAKADFVDNDKILSKDGGRY